MEMHQQQQPGRRRSMEDHLCGLWTNEKHVNFLNWMEDSFVRTMLDHRDNNNTRNNDRNNNRNNENNIDSRIHQLVPLDRFLPDSSESTRDLRRHHHKITTIKYPVVDADPYTATSAREEEEMTCLSLRPYDLSASSSNDQVVPQFGMIKAGGGVDDDDDDDNKMVDEEEEEEEKKG